MESHELLGREGPLTIVSDALAGSGGYGGALLLLGERGVGKTACLQAAQRMARLHAYLVLDTAGSAAETHLAYAGLQRLLRPLIRFADALPDVQRRALLAALGMHDGTSRDSLVLRVATMNLLREAAGRRGLVIIADDMQWLDEQTRHVLAFVARRLAPVHRIVAASSALADGLALGDAFHEVELGRLDESHAHHLVALHAPKLSRPRRVWVVNQAAGNPLALLELAKTAAYTDVVSRDPIGALWSLTPPLERAFAAGVGDLPALSRDVVLIAAVALDARLSEILAATALLRGHAVTTADIETPQLLGLLSVDETRVHFAHPLVKVAIVQKESVTRRQGAHRALGAVITLSSYRRAWHRALGTAEHDDAVAVELEATAPDSVGRGDTPAAIMALERAAELSRAPIERGRRLLLAARHAARLGLPEVVLRLLEAAAGGELSDFDRVRAELLREDFDGAVIADSNRVIQLCRLARRAATAGETVLSLELADAAVRRRCAAPVDAVARQHLTSLATNLADNSADARTVAVLALADPIGHGRAVLSTLATADDAQVSDGEQLSAYGIAARAVGHYSAASRFFDRAEVTLRAHGLLGPLARNLCVAADLRLELGEWDRATAALIGFEALSAASMSANHRASVLTTTAKITAVRGDVATALALASEAERAPAARSGSRFLARAQIARGIACIAGGRHDDAYAALSCVFDRADPSHHFREQFDAVAYLAEAAAHTNRHQDARAVMRQMRRIADVSGSPALLTHLAYADAVLATDDVAEQLFLAALASEAGGSPWQRSRIQLAYGRWLRRQHRVTQSREPLQASLTVLQHLGAARWAAEALDELGAAGVLGLMGPDGSAANRLTAQELKIAHFVARGLSNREIAQQLYLSPRTVSSHLYRIFPKLGISTRAQLAAQLTEVVGVGAAAEGQLPA